MLGVLATPGAGVRSGSWSDTLSFGAEEGAQQPSTARPASFPGRSRRESNMTYVIAEPCVDVMDQACVSVCPVDCIHFEEGVDRTLYIDPNECIDCGACEPECPVSAIFPEESLPAEWAG